MQSCILWTRHFRKSADVLMRNIPGTPMIYILVLTSDKKISIGRKKKRVLKSLVLKLKYDHLRPNEIAHLRGWISYLRSVEPAFVSSLEGKYDLDFSSAAVWRSEI